MVIISPVTQRACHPDTQQGASSVCTNIHITTINKCRSAEPSDICLSHYQVPYRGQRQPNYKTRRNITDETAYITVLQHRDALIGKRG